MSIQKSLSSLMVSGLVITGLIGFSASAAFSQERNTQESINTPTAQKTTNPIEKATQTNACPKFDSCY